jgi:outer membrane protein assembly complex protein YaeT
MRWTAVRRGLTVAALAAIVTACHEEGDVTVDSLSFEGTERIRADQLEPVLATRARGWLPWSEKPAFDRQAFEDDLARIRRFYQDRGYPEARIADVDVDLNDKGTEVDLTIRIDEGAPLRLAGVEYVGFDVLPDEVRPTSETTLLTVGEPRDRADVAAARQAALDRLRNGGYAYAEVAVEERPSPDGGSIVVFVATPGPATTFGPVAIVGLEGVDEAVVRRQLVFETGETYDHRRVVQSQRRLSSLEIFRFANIDATPPEQRRPEAIPIVITVAEAPPRRLQLGIGYGTEEQVRASAEWSHLNFVGGARQLATTAVWSSIDRGVRGNFLQPYWFKSGLSLDASLSIWWTNEDLYQSRTAGGRFGVRYRFGGGERGLARSPGDELRVRYIDETLSYTLRPEAFDLSNFEELIALGLDPISGGGSGRRTGIAVEYERDRADAVLNPRRGYGVSLHLEEARPWLGGGTFDYRELLGQGRLYFPIADRAVLATRLRAGSIIADSDADVPFSKRYFLGGASSLRGWGRFQVSPLVDGLPVGGRTLLESTLELRFPVTGNVSAALFADAGNVWAGSLDAQANRLRSDVGVGLRYRTPIGPVGADFGYQLNPIPGLIINGEPQDRRWRLHFSIGQTF